MNVLCYVTFSLLTMAGPFCLVSDCTLTRGGGPDQIPEGKIKTKVKKLLSNNFFVICRLILSGGGGSI